MHKTRSTLSDQLRGIIAGRGQSPAELSRLTGVDPTVLGRFLAAEREIRSGTLDQIAEALGLRLVEVEQRRPAKRKG